MSAQCKISVSAVFLFTLKKAALSFVVLEKRLLLAGILSWSANEQVWCGTSKLDMDNSAQKRGA